VDRLHLQSISELNDVIKSGGVSDLIAFSEELHSKRISRMAELIAARAPSVRIVLVSGPSAAGKTTTAMRLSKALGMNGITALRISTDDYFVGDKLNPRDAEGNLDYEHFDAVDRNRLSVDLIKIMAGEPFFRRKFDFVKHEGYDDSEMFVPPKNVVVLIEGIHALNPVLTEGIPDELKYRIYLNTLTQLVADEGGWLYYEDTRLMRRIVRDKTYRDMSPEKTILMWEKVSSGEMKWINPYRGYADSIFNTALDYEIAVMKPVLEPVLRNVPYLGGRETSEIKRLLAVLEAVEPVTDISAIPGDSILRESVGGSIFDYA
jgi:uridine kinase